MNVYLKIEYSTGKVYEYSKDEKEGFEKHTSEKGKETYRRYFPRGVYGTLRGVTIREVEFNGTKTKEVSVAMRDKDQNNVYLNLPLFDGKKNITDYAEGVISYLGGLTQRNEYRIYPFNIPNENNPKYSTVGVSIKTANLETEKVDEDSDLPKLKKSYTKKDGTKVVGEIPEIIFEKDFDGSWTKDAKARNKFLYQTLEAFVENGNSVEETTTPAPKAEAKPAIQPDKSFDKVAPSVDNDDLPFG